MGKYRRVLGFIILCLFLSAGAFLLASRQMESIFAYRSPLKDTPPQPGEPIGPARARQVVFVLIDALREDTSLKPAVMPYLNGLRQQGATARMHSQPPSFSEPGYTVLLTGAWPDVSDGPPINLDYDQIPTWTQDNLFSGVNQAGGKTAVSGYYWFEKLIPQDAVNASYYTSGEDQKADRAVVEAALPWIRSAEYSLVLVHIDQVDYAGHHEGGPRDPRWDQAASRADELLGEIAGAMDLSKDVLLVTSDHGQIDRGGHGGPEPITLVEPFVLVGAGVKPGNYGDVNMVDVAPTLAVLSGANLPATSQGRVLVEMLAMDETSLAALPQALKTQQSQMVAAYQSAIGRRFQPVLGDDIVGAYQAALQSARASRLWVERAQRLILALLIAGLPLVLVIRNRSRTTVVILATALLYIFIYNYRYAVLDGNTYSLSSVSSADQLIQSGLTGSALALGVTWLVYSLQVALFVRGSRRAFELTQGLVLAIVYLLTLPVLFSFVLNGLLVSWTLPEFVSFFVGFQSLLQILFVSIFGLLLAGFSAGITWLAERISRPNGSPEIKS